MLTRERILFSRTLDKAFLSNWRSQVLDWVLWNICTEITGCVCVCWGGAADGWLICEWKVPGKCLDYRHSENLGSFNKQPKFISAVDLLPHTWMWKWESLFLNTDPCGPRMASVLFRRPVKVEGDIMPDTVVLTKCVLDLLSHDSQMKPGNVFEQPDFNPILHHREAIGSKIQIHCLLYTWRCLVLNQTVNSEGHMASMTLKMVCPLMSTYRSCHTQCCNYNGTI